MPVCFGINTGDWPSGPPPRGKIVVLLAKRRLIASEGYNLSARNRSVALAQARGGKKEEAKGQLDGFEQRIAYFH
jgi:hypothetical protein